MKKYLFGLLLSLIFAVFSFPKTHAYWARTLPSDAVLSSALKIGIWKKYTVLEEVGRLESPKAGTEFLFQNRFYVVLWDFEGTVIPNINWWGWNNAWSGINLVSEEWLNANYYNQKSLPVKKDGADYLAIHEGATNHVPGTHSSWFKISEWYLSTNIYMKGYIVKHGLDPEGKPRYWAAKQYVNPGYTPGNYDWAWEEILEWQGHAEAGKIYYRFDSEGNVRFWKALKAASLEPSEEAARTGYFDEIKNGWISPVKEHEIITVWVGHNIYSPGDVITYGTDNCLRYRYFQAKKQSVGEVPYSVLNGKETINGEYWVEIR